jgi:hypothetical protein
MRKAALLFFLVVFLTACGNNSFRTKAVYVAPESGFRLEVIAWGTIEQGQDIANGGEYDAHFSPLSKQGEPFTFEWRQPDKEDLSNYVLTLQRGDERQTYGADVYLEDILEDTLYGLGYDNAQTYEAQEAIFAIYGAAYGPKATVMPGQAKFLEVVEVELNYKGN